MKRELEAKVYAGERLTRADGVALYAADDLAWLGRLAHHKRTQLTGDRVTFGPAGPAEETAGPQDWLDHVLKVKETPRVTGAAPAELLKIFAVTRLLLDVPRLSCRWDVYGLPIAQLALNFGADDLSAEELPEDRDELLHLIWDAGFQPVERDARYQVVEEHEKATSLAERRSEPQKIWA
ncbi:hypothetical protein GCM10009828_009920 [Actinoplanes couchii]|uniref:Uncharacterized protein n=1 Tax=Actinoplanes couchii TaxID=403638 RepID=A0ABQ3XIW9_9ACTN|nr:hypothetical protein Aco03nite_068370 [Actinoplanes couchii]